jgi:hypothetical protein
MGEEALLIRMAQKTKVEELEKKNREMAKEVTQL